MRAEDREALVVLLACVVRKRGHERRHLLDLSGLVEKESGLSEVRDRELIPVEGPFGVVLVLIEP